MPPPRSARSRPNSTRICAHLASDCRVVDRQPRAARLAARLAEHLHHRLQLALVAAVLAGPAAGQPELREELVGAARVRAGRPRRRRARPSSQNSASGAPKSEPPPMKPSPPCAFRCSKPALDMNGPKTRSRSTTAARRLEELLEVRRRVLERDDVSISASRGRGRRSCRRACRAASCRPSAARRSRVGEVLVVRDDLVGRTSSRTAAPSTRRRRRPPRRACRASSPASRAV